MAGTRRASNYGNTVVDTANVQEFVEGIQAQNAQGLKTGTKALAGAALGVVAYQLLRPSRRGR